MSESLQIRIKNKFRKLRRRISEKGHERLTFMIIPHGEKHLFSMQISKFTIGFALAGIIAIISASILSWNLQMSIQGEVNELLNVSHTVVNERDQYMNQLDKLKELQEQIREWLTRIYLDAQLTQDAKAVMPTKSDLRETAAEQIDTEGKEFVRHMLALSEAQQDKSFSIDSIQNSLLIEFRKSKIDKNFKYSDDVVEYREMRLELLNTIASLRTLRDFLTERISVQKTLPYFWPIKDGQGHITSLYGLRISPFGLSTDFHTGIDIADTTGTTIEAAGDGVVLSAGYMGGYGLAVRIQHRFGFETIYGHMSATRVYAGQRVVKGQPVGLVGQTGRATGPHLHFEVRLEGKTVNPFPYITAGT